MEKIGQCRDKYQLRLIRIFEISNLSLFCLPTHLFNFIPKYELAHLFESLSIMKVDPKSSIQVKKKTSLMPFMFLTHNGGSIR